jgi:hypothetical protein
MNMATKNNIFEEFLEEYISAGRERKGEILDHIIKTTKMKWRESAVRRFRRMQLRDPARVEGRGRKVYYTKDVDGALFDIWETANEMCGELLFYMIKEYVLILQRDGMWKHGDEATSKLLAMKKRTVRRRCEDFKRKHGAGKGKSVTKPSHLKSIIPIFKGPWNDLPPGNGQLDTVAHCGNTLLGDFVFTLNYTDSATYWVIPRAQWNKGAEATKDSMEKACEKFPVKIAHIHPDTGSEFINHTLKPWCDENKIKMTRSEPGRKNDNMYVEERNGHVVRKYLGYTRFDCKETVDLINEMYDELALYLNHFQTVRRTLSKERIGAKYKRTYEKIAKTPYERMCEHPAVSGDIKEKMRVEHERLNPLVLKKKIDTIIVKIMRKQRNHMNQN